MGETRTEKHYDLSPQELAGIFVMKGWVYGATPTPSGKDIEKVVDGIVDTLRRQKGKYGELGRFHVVKDPEFPNSYEILLKVGYVSDYPVDMDKPE